MSMLEVKDLRVSYGAIEAIKGISLRIEQGQVVTLIGTNGAGKTTTLRTLSGLLHPTAGEILFEGERLDQLPAHEVVRRGVAHSPEGRRIFPLMTVEENLELGGYSRRGESLVKDVEAVFERFPRLLERRAQKAGTLSGGEQQMLAIGRALMSRPRLLMLDEPSMGLSPIMMQLIFSTLAELRDAGTTILLVEQNASASPRAGRRRLRARDGEGRAHRHRPGAARGRAGPEGLPRRGLGSPPQGHGKGNRTRVCFWLRGRSSPTLHVLSSADPGPVPAANPRPLLEGGSTAERPLCPLFARVGNKRATGPPPGHLW
jgi:branched-chain amino acid transport system ATP-binding protein